MPSASSPEDPTPVRVVSQQIGEWIARLGKIWVDGQVVEVDRYQGFAFLTLRDVAADISLKVTCSRRVLDAVSPTLQANTRVVLHARPTWYLKRGQLSLAADEIRHVGVGELLARLERLRVMLAAEGLFAAERKRPLPFLPQVVGLVCGRSSAAERDVVENARRRWPAVRFRIEEVAVQGVSAVSEVTAALARLDADPEVEVIVLARGGGALEDLLAFSDEALVRAVVATRTPVVSAIGHEEDVPLVDLAADVRASTPTDAGRRVVPDVTEEALRIAELRRRVRVALRTRLDRESTWLAAVRSRPSLADPYAALDTRAQEVQAMRDRAGRAMRARLDRAADGLVHTRARVLTLSPAATLQRGYAVVQREDGGVVDDPRQVVPGEFIGIRVAHGRFAAQVSDVPSTPRQEG
ncbi:MAG: exodeoxyribonuclease VII large subunit [Actinomycetes bacterium]